MTRYLTNDIPGMLDDTEEGNYSPAIRNQLSGGHNSHAGSCSKVTTPNSPGSQIVTPGPQTNPGDMGLSSSSGQNVTKSEYYDRLLKTKECGPITDPTLHQECVASFTEIGAGPWKQPCPPACREE